MKKSTLFFLLFLSTVFAFSQTGCSKYYPFSEGTFSELTMFDDKGKTAAIVEYTVVGVNKSGGGETASMASTVKDSKGKVLAESTYDVNCKNNMVSIDFKSMMSPQMLEPFKDMDMEISGQNIEFPNNLSVGQTLPDASTEIKINMNGMSISIAISMTNRKVETKEGVTTPAGTFNAYLISHDSAVQTMGMNEISRSKLWIAEGVGTVKMENYDKKGKLTSSGKLTKFEK